MAKSQSGKDQMKRLRKLRCYALLESCSPLSPSQAISMGVGFGALVVVALPVGLAIQEELLGATRSLGWSMAMGAVAASLGITVAWVMEPLSWRGYIYRTLREVQPVDKAAFLALLDDLDRDGYDSASLSNWLKQEARRLDHAQRAADKRRKLLEEEQVSEIGQFRQLMARRQTLR